MDEQFVRNRIVELRIRLNKSEREMSLDLGHSSSYINGISSGRTSPSLKEFLYICDYLKVTPEEFFSTAVSHSAVKQVAIHHLSTMNEDDIEALLPLLQQLSKK